MVQYVYGAVFNVIGVPDMFSPRLVGVRLFAA